MMFRDVKKGFTFVELAIVLVIIGIIMGMALKGRQLIEGAKTRSEVRKLEKLQSAVAGWYSNTGTAATPAEFQRLSPGSTNCSADNGTKAGITTNATDGPLCLNVRVLTDVRVNDVQHTYGDNWTMFGGTWGIDNASVMPGNNFLLITTATPRFACNVENMMDGDMFFRGGDVKATYNENRVTGDVTPIDPKTSNPSAFRTCDEWNNTYDAGHYLGYQLAL